MARKAPVEHSCQGMSLTDAMKMFPDDHAAEAWFMRVRWPHGPVCPECGSRNVQTGAAHRMPLRCHERRCRKRFSVRYGSVMQSSKLGYRVWAMAICLSLKSVSPARLYRDLDITQKSAWHLAHRLRKAFEGGGSAFADLVEVESAGKSDVHGSAAEHSAPETTVYRNEADEFPGHPALSVGEGADLFQLSFPRKLLARPSPHVQVNEADTESLSLDRSALICGDARRSLRLLPDSSIQTVVTSPPYWSLRDYAVEDQIGRDDTLSAYIDSIVSTFDEVHRVLRPDGTVWLNVGDSFTSGNRRYRAPDRKNRARAMAVRPPTPDGLKPKDLIGVPWRLALALQDAGWWLRAEVIWHKPNAHPESVRDRPTKAHETVFLLSRNENYYYDLKAVRGPGGRRLRTVWEIATEPVRRLNGHSDDHPAMMPMSLARRCVSITSREDSIVLDPYAGAGTSLLAARSLGRRWVGIEINRAFVDLIERRMGGA